MKRIIIAFVLLTSVLVSTLAFDFDFGGFGGFPGGNKAMDKADDLQDTMNGQIPLRFFNALDRSPVSGALIHIPNVGNFTTDQRGRILFPKIPDGAYTLTFSKEGFITTDITFRVQLGGVVFNWFNVSPGIPDKDYRIVLEWGERPADLDIHFEKSGGTGGYHISYSRMRMAEDGNAVLDRDERQGYGPETVTIGRIDSNATYICWVHDYTNRNNPQSVQMAQNGATIRVYSNNRLVNTFHIPAGAAGTKWNVFRIERGGRLVGVNTVDPR